MRIVEVRRAKPPKKMVFIKLANDQGFTLELASYAEKHTTMLQKALAGADRLESLEGLVSFFCFRQILSFNEIKLKTNGRVCMT